MLIIMTTFPRRYYILILAKVDLDILPETESLFHFQPSLLLQYMNTMLAAPSVRDRRDSFEDQDAILEVKECMVCWKYFVRVFYITLLLPPSKRPCIGPYASKIRDEMKILFSDESFTSNCALKQYAVPHKISLTNRLYRLCHSTATMNRSHLPLILTRTD